MTAETMKRIIDYTPGFHEGVPAKVYHERILGLVNKGALDILDRKTPMHYRHWLTEEQGQDTPALKLGRAFHVRVLQPDLFAASYISAQEHPYRRPSIRQINAKNPSSETLAAIRYFSEWDKLMGGREELDDVQMETVNGMYDAVMRDPIAGPALERGRSEIVAIWNDPDSGIQCKAMFDSWLEDVCIIPDLKSTDDASENAFARSVAKYRYHVQSAHYRAAARVLTGGNADMPFIAVESTAPYAVNIMRLDSEAMSRGDQIRQRALERLSECLMTDQWPGHGDGVKTISLPPYAFYD